MSAPAVQLPSALVAVAVAVDGVSVGVASGGIGVAVGGTGVRVGGAGVDDIWMGDGEQPGSMDNNISKLTNMLKIR